MVIIQAVGNTLGAISRQHVVVDSPYDYCFLRHDFRRIVFSTLIAIQPFVLEGHLSGLHCHALPDRYIRGYGFTLSLGKAPVKGQHQLAREFQCVDILLFKQDSDPLFFQQPHILQAVYRVARKAGYALGKDEVYMTTAAERHELIELIPVPGGGT